MPGTWCFVSHKNIYNTVTASMAHEISQRMGQKDYKSQNMVKPAVK